MARMTKAERERRQAQRRELGAMLLIGLALFVAAILWLPQGLTGELGAHIGDFLVSLFGTAAHLTPFLCSYLALELFLARELAFSRKRQILTLCLFLALMCLISVFTVSEDELIRLATVDGEVRATRVLSLLWQARGIEEVTHASAFWYGGFFATLMSLGLVNVVGQVGAVILLAIALLMILLLLFNFSYASLIRSGYLSLMSYKSDYMESRRDHRARALEENEMIRPEPDDRRLGRDTVETVEELMTEHDSQEELNRLTNMSPRDEWSASEFVRSTAIPSSGFQLEESTSPEISGNSWSSDDALTFGLPDGDWRLTDLAEAPGAYASSDELSALPQLDSIDRAEMSPPPEVKIKSEESLSAFELDEDILARAQEIEALSESLQAEDARDNWQDRQEGATLPKKKAQQLQVYAAPPMKLLQPEQRQKENPEQEAEIRLLGATLEKTLNDFGISAKVINFTTGPTISRFEIAPGPGVKVSKIVSLADDIALALAATAVRIEAPIPGKSAVGIEIPNKQTSAVLLRGILEDRRFQENKAPLLSAIGRDIQGEPIFCDIAKMPHLLIAGATGSGKSVCINSILISLLYRSGPEDLRLLMIDPKVVELSVYNGIPHLLQPVVTNPKKATAVLRWAVDEMSRRYNLFAHAGVRDFTSFNDWLASGHFFTDPKLSNERLPYIVLVIDELSDLMATSAAEVEESISRLTAMARAAGIHLIIATQRPSVDVITGVIKANIPSRIAFAVASQVDSRTILDLAGAEKLLGKGDMIYAPQSSAKSLRGQGSFVTDREVEAVVKYLKSHFGEQYDEEVGEAIENSSRAVVSAGAAGDDDEMDELLPDAMQVCLDNDYASISLLQRRLNIGYPRAARIVDQLHDVGAIGPFEGSKPRKIVVKDMKQFHALLNPGEGN